MRVSALRVAIVAASVCVLCDERPSFHFCELHGAARAFARAACDLAVVCPPLSIIVLPCSEPSRPSPPGGAIAPTLTAPAREPVAQAHAGTKKRPSAEQRNGHLPCYQIRTSVLVIDRFVACLCREHAICPVSVALEMSGLVRRARSAGGGSDGADRGSDRAGAERGIELY
jgi:hypothetical protein